MTDLFAPRERPRVMGVLNVTPDSFSDGGRYAAVGPAVQHGLEMTAAGADLVDVGGESTRPGATRPLVDEELHRVLPVVRELTGQDVTVSVDTMRAEVAEAAVAAGAQVVNDVSGGLADPRILDVVRDSGAVYVAMHWRAHSDRMTRHADYPEGVVAGVRAELEARLEAIESAGVDPDRVILDPGLGFAKTQQHNWELLQHLDEIEQLGRPVLVGASRKSFLGGLLGTGDVPRPVDQREAGHLALVVLLAQYGVWGLRVHDVRATTDALAVLDRIAQPSAPPPRR